MKHPGHLLRRVAFRSDQVRPSDIADEKRVTGKYFLRLIGYLSIDDQDRDAFGSMAGRLQKSQDGSSDFDLITVFDCPVRESRFRLPAEYDLGSSPLREFAMSADEIGVQVGFDDIFDHNALRG